MTNKKVLYFEGAGWADADISKKTDLENCRIRTVFTNNEGRKIYLELISYEKSISDKKINRYPEHQIGDVIGFIDFCFYIDTESKDPCNECTIEIERKVKFNYCKSDLLKLINEKLNCSFDDIITLNDLSGYRVHGDNRAYNMMENYIYEPKLIEKRKEIHKYFYKLEKSEGKKYPNFSLWVDENDKNILHLLRHFNGYNKHWTIRTDAENWLDTVTETKLGKYAC